MMIKENSTYPFNQPLAAEEKKKYTIIINILAISVPALSIWIGA